MDNNKFYKEFRPAVLKELPISHQMLTVFKSDVSIITSQDSTFNGIEIKKYNTELLGGTRHYAPISKMIDFG
ncbi:hypothetical protein ABW636_20755 [Aquimarina sp. 2201CG1-2-11]|uniref:hypothetical protein n=1 Tax=Aquimarina discodermiae TaxID=3231043 RepID=UPI00346328A8